MNYSREYVGNVRVTSGRLVISDPATLAKAPELAKIIQGAATAAALAEEGESGEIGPGHAVACGTPFSDGEYPVFLSKNDKGELAIIEIRLQEES